MARLTGRQQGMLNMWKTIAAKLAFLVIKANYPDMGEAEAERQAAALLAGCVESERKGGRR